MESAHLEREHEPYIPDLRIGYLFGKAWELYKSNLGVVVGATVVYMLITLILTGGDQLGIGGGMRITGNLLMLILAGPLTVGLYSVMVRVVRSEEVSIPGLFDGFQHFGRAVGVYLLSLLAIIVGFILLIIPGIIIAVGLYPVEYLVYDERRGVVETLQRAWDLTRGHKFELFVVGVAALFVTLLGLLALGVGIIFTGAFAYLVGAVVYEELSLGAA